MSAMGSPTSGQPFSFGYDSKGGTEAQFRGMDNNITCFRSVYLFEFRVQLPAVIYNGALKFLKICSGGSYRYGWQLEKQDGK
jgi:hypothetical protein